MRAAINFYSVAALALASLAVAPAQAGEDGKQAMFDTIDRNAEQMTAISDALFYFGELGMQEFESTKLLKDTLEAGGLQRRTRRRRHADQSLGGVAVRAGPRSRS